MSNARRIRSSAFRRPRREEVLDLAVKHMKFGPWPQLPAHKQLPCAISKSYVANVTPQARPLGRRLQEIVLRLFVRLALLRSALREKLRPVRGHTVRPKGR